MCSRAPRRFGFSAIDLTVLIGVIGFLATLALPALVQAQQAATKKICFNNLRILGLASHNYHDANLHFPTEQDGKGVYEQLLAYVEEQNADPKKPKPIKVFLCPERHKPTAAYRDYVYVYDNKLVDSPILYEKKGATLAAISNANGVSNTALLAHVWMDPKNYAKDKATWADKTQQVKSAASKPDSKENANGLGSPHMPGNLYLFADGHVQSIAYGWNDPKGAQEWMWNWKNKNAYKLP